jgi:hypothetical protein
MPLLDLLRGLTYKPGWSFYYIDDYDRGQGSVGATLLIQVSTLDTYHPENKITVNHLMPIPPASYDKRSWRRWLFEQILLVERHESCEWFNVDGLRPYSPSHGPGNDPYLVREVGTVIDQRTSFRGDVSEP